MEEELLEDRNLTSRSIQARPVEARRRRDIAFGNSDSGVRNSAEVKPVTTSPQPVLGVQAPFQVSGVKQSGSAAPKETFADRLAAQKERDKQAEAARIASLPSQLELNEQSAIDALNQELKKQRTRQPLEREKIKRAQDIRFKPLEEELGRESTQARTEQSIGRALTGASRGNRARLETKLLDDSIKRQERALANQKQAAINLRIAQSEGKDEAIINSLRRRVDNAAKAVDEAAFERRRVEQGVADKQFDLQKSELAQQQRFELAEFENQLRTAPTSKEKREILLEQVNLGGKDFLNSLGEDQIGQLEKDAGYTPGFLNALKNQQAISVATGAEFTFTDPRVNEFGQIVMPGYIFNKATGEVKEVLPGGGTQNVQLGGIQTLNAQQNFKGFDEYSQKVGNGNVIKGSPKHKGFEVDIDGKVGDPIPAFTGGKVVEVKAGCAVGDKECNGGYGNTVVVEDSQGNRVRYAHLDQPSVTQGQLIPPGSQVGTMGNTGFVIPMGEGDGSHLHIEARDKNNKLVPLQSIAVRDVIAPPNMSGLSVDDLRAEALVKGYNSKNEQQAYVHARQHGAIPPDRTQLDMDDRLFSQANNLRDEFNAIQPVKDYLQVRGQADSVKRIVESGVGGSADLALVFSFMKALDPNSVVRESEYDAAAQSGNIFAGKFAQFNGYLRPEGGFLPENVKQNFLKLSQEALKSKETGFREQLDRYTNIANEFEIDPSLVVGDYTIGSEEILGEEIRTPEGPVAPNNEQLDSVNNQINQFQRLLSPEQKAELQSLGLIE